MGASDTEQGAGTFWDHLDILRGCLFKIAIAVVGFSIVVFCFKEWVFDIVLAPRNTDFITYRLLGIQPEKVSLMNTGLTEQFMIHMKTSFYVGFLLASPYVLYEIFSFISPGLYDNERRYAIKLVGGVYIMFMLGTALNYFAIFPMTINFLGFNKAKHLYQVIISQLYFSFTPSSLISTSRKVVKHKLDSHITSGPSSLVNTDATKHLTHTTFA